MGKRILALTLAFVMLLAMVPAAGAATEAETKYLDDGDVTITNRGSYIITQRDPSTPVIHTVTIKTSFSVTSGFDITLKDINIDVSDTSAAAICVSNNYTKANVVITLEGNNQVRSGSGKAGIDTSCESSTNYQTTLTIRGNGSLEAHGGDHSAGIGAALGSSCGVINIESGTIKAYGGKGAAGIGGGDVVADTSLPNGGNGGIIGINISGGTIYAGGKENPDETNTGTPYGAAGIGGGYFGGNSTINISGGDITAQGAAKSPCIGCSNYASGSLKLKIV